MAIKDLKEMVMPNVQRMNANQVTELARSLAKKPRDVLIQKQNELIKQVKDLLSVGKKESAAELQAQQAVLAQALGIQGFGESATKMTFQEAAVVTEMIPSFKIYVKFQSEDEKKNFAKTAKHWGVLDDDLAGNIVVLQVTSGSPEGAKTKVNKIAHQSNVKVAYTESTGRVLVFESCVYDGETIHNMSMEELIKRYKALSKTPGHEALPLFTKELKARKINLKTAVTESLSVQTHDLSRGKKNPYRLEVDGYDGYAVIHILNNKADVGLGARAYGNEVGFPTKSARASAASYLRGLTLKESDTASKTSYETYLNKNEWEKKVMAAGAVIQGDKETGSDLVAKKGDSIIGTWSASEAGPWGKIYKEGHDYSDSTQKVNLADDVMKGIKTASLADLIAIYKRAANKDRPDKGTLQAIKKEFAARNIDLKTAVKESEDETGDLINEEYEIKIKGNKPELDALYPFLKERFDNVQRSISSVRITLEALDEDEASAEVARAITFGVKHKELTNESITCEIAEAFGKQVVHPSRRGMFKGVTLAELRKKRKIIKDKMKKFEKSGKKVPQTLRTQIAQVNFAIRAKQKGGSKWGKIKEDLGNFNGDQQYDIDHGSEFDTDVDDNDQIDTLTMDIPLLIRIFEYCREDLKSDEELHDMVERMLNVKNEVLTMHDYDEIIGQDTDDDYDTDEDDTDQGED